MIERIPQGIQIVVHVVEAEYLLSLEVGYAASVVHGEVVVVIVNLQCNTSNKLNYNFTDSETLGKKSYYMVRVLTSDAGIVTSSVVLLAKKISIMSKG